MMRAIDPENWDVIVLGSGLPECMIASSLAKAGKSVLLVEQEDTYGSEYASCTLQTFRSAALGQHASLTAPPHGTEEEGPGAHKEPTTATSNELSNAQPSIKPAPAPVPCAGCSLPSLSVALPPFQAPLFGVERDASAEAVLHNSKAFILDLMPKLMYQGEPLVELLVKARGHHYLEFRRLEGSYYVAGSVPVPKPTPEAPLGSSAATSSEGGVLRAVPASKSDIFKDRSLSLSEKRSLMGFLASAMEAAQGAGKLKGIMSSCTPLAEVLKAEGVPFHLRQLVLHGIAMSDVAQEAGEEGGAEGVSQHAGDSGGQVSAREGAEALQLLAESTAKFGGPGAFMVPLWGCGSLPEAFVRSCAVNGGTTVLRCRVKSALLLQRSEGPTDGAVSGWLVDAVVVESGQVLKCRHLVASAAVMRVLSRSAIRHAAASSICAPGGQAPGASSAASGSASKEGQPSISTAASVEAETETEPAGLHPSFWVYRALVIMDHSLVKGQTVFTLVIPPRSSALGATNRHAVRGLQLGPALSVCPPGR